MPITEDQNHYERLGIERTATLPEVKEAGRRLLLEKSLDKNMNKTDKEKESLKVEMRLVLEAWKVDI